MSFPFVRTAIAFRRSKKNGSSKAKKFYRGAVGVHGEKKGSEVKLDLDFEHRNMFWKMRRRSKKAA